MAGLQQHRVSDLSPLQGTALKTLRCENTNVSDLLPLIGMPLTNLHIDFKPKRDTEILGSIKSLERINNKSVAEFWKEVYEQQDVFEKWVEDVSGLPAEEQIALVTKKLRDLNPKFDERVTHLKIDQGVVTELRFNTENVTDISPVRALSGLKSLEIYGEQLKGVLADLSPLKEMNLTTLYCYRSKVADLSPLKGMPLVNFNCGATNVTDLSPLHGMPLVALTCSNNPQLADISALKGMPLRNLAVHNTKSPTSRR